MPKTKDYKGKSAGNSNKRRPRHEMSDEAIEAVQSEEAAFDGAEASQELNTEAVNEGLSAADAAESVEVEVEETPAEKAYEAAYEEPAPSFSSDFSDSSKEEKIHLEFYGSDIIREKAPQIMDLADTVADEWVKDGQFQGLPVGNPIAQLAAAKALRTAKDVEKKLEEKGVFMMAKIGLDYLKSKIDKK